MAGHGILILVSVYRPPKKELLRSDLKVLFTLEDAVILFGDLNSKNTTCNCNCSNRNGSKLVDLAGNLHFNIVTPPTPTHNPFNDNHRSDVLDIALMKGVALRLSCIETLQCLNSDHRPVLIRLGSLAGDCPPLNKTVTNWQKVFTVLQKIDIPILNNIPNDIVSTDDIDHAIGALINHIRTVVDNSSWVVPVNSDRKELPRHVSELIRAENAALRRAGTYPTCENRSHARDLQRKVKGHMEEVRKENSSDLIEGISPSHQTYWGLAKALKTEGPVPVPALRKPEKSTAFDDREKAECLADNIEHQCSENPPYDLEHVRRVEEEVRHRVSHPPKDDLDPITHDDISKHIKDLKIRKAPSMDSISSKALKCFSAPLVALLVGIFNVCIKNCYFLTACKEAVVIGIPKPRKPHDLPASYRPISLLSTLGK
ncbi:RNA-directed DNA polymerase from mobile element jockey [Eumeta japonica]|uniref:RNA-directed DNA polymerase from mobile element jockey n=1 Tax=Eumeta variegata TaxID=151549 RepID=A0A4C1ZRL1_EUMVA|nr:RNA-directed DNA polymerase from mobile element jockey [Eumeta japonica]